MKNSAMGHEALIAVVIAIGVVIAQEQYTSTVIGQSAAQVNFMEVQVDLGAPIEVPKKPWEAIYVIQWGKTSQGKAWPILNDATYLDGDAGIGNGAKPTAWSTIRGGFNAVTATTDKAIIVSGQMELVGGGGGSGYTHLRYALTFIDSTTLKSQNTDSATWVNAGKLKHYGYEFCPRTGPGTMAIGAWGVGTVGVVKNGNWNSTSSNGGKAISAVKQAPTNAEMVAGTYNWAISVRPLANGFNEVRWYMVEKDNKYWFGGTAIDSSAVTAKFNGICFGFNNDQSATQVNFMAVQVDLGEPIKIPKAPWEAFYVSDWGFIGGRFGGWKFTPGDFEGDVMISGDAPNTGWVAVRGGFMDPITPTRDSALIVTGKVEFVGGGFEGPNSLRFGVFYSDSAGDVIDTPIDSTRWSGTGAHHSGYLFIPPSGVRPSGVHTRGVYSLSEWPGNLQGTCVAVIDGDWFIPEGANNYFLDSNIQVPAEAAGGAGIYEFAISVSPQDGGMNEIRFFLMKRDSGYCFAGKIMDVHHPVAAGKFNCVCFALNTNAATTAMNLYEVWIGIAEPLSLPTGLEEVVRAGKPWEYALGQNYPNPFNPTTRIQYSVPKSDGVSLKVYNLLGQEVATLYEGVRQAGNYVAGFDGEKFAPGVYFCQLKSDDHVKTKKLILLK